MLCGTDLLVIEPKILPTICSSLIIKRFKLTESTKALHSETIWGIRQLLSLVMKLFPVNS